MKNQFYNNFTLSNKNIISICGEGNNAVLIHLLAQVAVIAGYRALVIATGSQKYPIEGKVLISDETDLLLRLIRSEQSEVTYLARKVSGDLLIPFNEAEIKALLKQVDDDIKFFISCNPENKPSKTYNRLIAKSLQICTINFNAMRNQLLEIYENTTIRSSSIAQKKIKDQFIQLIDKNCPSFASIEDKSAHVLYIDQVKNVLDENLLIPVARHLKLFRPVKILYGNVHHYHVKEI